MPPKRLNIPDDLSSVNLTKGVDTLEIVVTKTCTWCYTDPDSVFPAPPGFLAAGTYNVTDPHTKYGPYTPQNDGVVNFGASIPPIPCSTEGIQGTPHTITVTGGNMPGSKK
jgi:hypothetical protein